MGTSSLVPATPEQLADLSRDLVSVGERLEALDSPLWLVAARAAALVDGLRFGMVATAAALPTGVEVCHGSQH